MTWKRFAKIHDGRVVSIVETKAESIEGMMDITGRDVLDGADYDAETDTFTAPNPNDRRLLKALVLMTKFLLNETGVDKSKIPPEALEIWQDIKDDRL